MERLLVDTNIVLDLLLDRKPFYTHAAGLFSIADRDKDVQLAVSSLTFNNLDYILSKESNREHARNVLKRLRILVEVLSVDNKIIDLSLASPFTDFEDAIQYYSALQNNIEILVTRNLKDFKHAAIQVMTAEQYVKSYYLRDR